MRWNIPGVIGMDFLKRYYTARNVTDLLQVVDNKFLVRLHGEYNILVKLCGNTT